MEKVILFIISFILVYLLYLGTVVLQRKKMDKYKKSSQVQFFVKKYGLQFKNITVIKFVNILAFSNAFILSFTLTVTDFIDNFLLKMLAAFITLIPLILLVYYCVGCYVRWKEGKPCTTQKK